MLCSQGCFFTSCKISSRPPQLYLLANAMTDEIIKIDAFDYYTKIFVMLVPYVVSLSKMIFYKL